MSVQNPQPHRRRFGEQAKRFRLFREHNARRFEVTSVDTPEEVAALWGDGKFFAEFKGGNPLVVDTHTSRWFRLDWEDDIVESLQNE